MGSSNTPFEHKLKPSHFFLRNQYHLFLLFCAAVVSSLLATLIFGPLALLLPVGVIASFTIFVFRPQWGLAILLVELILGGNGHWLELLNLGITPRYLLIAATVLGYSARKVLSNSWQSNALFARYVLLFLLVVAGGVLLGIWNGNDQPAQDAQVWIYLILYFIVVDLYASRGLPPNIIRLFLWCITAVAFTQLAITVAVNLYPSEVITLFYRPLQKVRILITPLAGSSLYYVFMGNSSLYSFLFAVPVMVLASPARKRFPIPVPYLIMMVLVALAATILGMTRGTWMQLVLTASLILGDLLLRKKSPKHMFASLTLLGLFMVLTVLTVEPMQEALSDRIATLLPGNFSKDASISYKVMENKLLWEAIGERPIFGYGFGEGQYTEDFPTLRGVYFHNSYFQFALKTGMMGLSVLLLLLALICWIPLQVSQLIGRDHPEHRVVLRGMVYSLASLLLTTTTNPHMTTPAFVVTLALILALADLSYKSWQRTEGSSLPS